MMSNTIQRALYSIVILVLVLIFYKNTQDKFWISTKYLASKLPKYNSSVSTKLHVGTRANDKQHKRSHLVTLGRFMGRLGNNMFQIATLLGVAATYGYSPVIMQNREILKIFHLPTRVNFKLENVQKFHERFCCAYDKRVKYLDHTKNWTLSGCLQSWKYFKGAEDTVRKTFTFKKEYLLKVQNYLSSISKPGVVKVGVHVRRGDFLRLQKRGYAVAPVSYIRNAMKYFYDKCKKVQFVFASGDLKWCKDNFKDKNVYVSPFHDKVLDMALVSSCDHTIITSGSFSWWIGWLSKGTTIYYKGYPANGSSVAKQFDKSGNYNDYYPRDWLGMY